MTAGWTITWARVRVLNSQPRKPHRKAPKPSPPSPTTPAAPNAQGRTPNTEHPIPSTYEPPLLLALFLAPLVGGMFDARPSAGGGLAWMVDFPLLAPLGRYPPQLWLALIGGLVWLAFVLRLTSRQVRGEPLPLTPALGWLWAFTLLAAASIITSVYRGASLVTAASYGSWLGAAFLAAEIGRRPGGAARLLGAILAGTTVAAAIGLRQT